MGSNLMYLDENGNEITVYLDENGNEIQSIPSESPTEMRARAKAEFASDWLKQKQEEAESIRETTVGKVVSALFPRSVENEIDQRQIGRQDSEVPYLAYDALKDITSLPGRILYSGYDKEVKSKSPFGKITESMSNLDGWFGKKLVTDPLAIPALASGLAIPSGITNLANAAAIGSRIALGAAIPSADITIEKSKIGEQPSSFDYLVAAASGIIPELLGKFIKPRAIASEMTDPAEEGMRRLLAEGDQIRYLGKSDAFRRYQNTASSIDEALGSGLISPSEASRLYPKFPKRPIESVISDKIESIPPIIKSSVRVIAPGINSAEAAARGTGKAVGMFSQIPESDNITRAILASYASEEITPTERNAYLRAVETGDDRLIREYREKYLR